MCHLNNLFKYDKATCVKYLEEAKSQELWDHFLKGQSKLFFDSEFQWISKQTWWQQAKKILEIGSGNGAHLSKLFDRCPDKTFLGIEKLQAFVKEANALYANDSLAFQEGDAEIFNTHLVHSADIVLFRLTLQHLQDPIAALTNASHYVWPHGYVFIIEACDKAKRTSHPIKAIDKALKLVEECQRTQGNGNRQISLALLQALVSEKSLLSKLYEVIFTNIDATGNILCDRIQFEKKDQALHFNHSLLFLTLLHRTYQIPIDLSTAYDELQAYSKDKEAWTSPGWHFLVLKRLTENLREVEF